MTRFLGVLLAGCVFAVPTVALACAGPVCIDPWAPSAFDGGAVPSNLAAFTLTNSARPFNAAVPDAGVSLTREDGGLITVDLSLENSVITVKPLQALSNGERVTLSYPALCPLSNAPSATFQKTYAIGPAVAAPTSIGSFTLRESGYGPTSVYESGACSAVTNAAFATFAFVPSAELIPFLPVTRWVLSVDGKDWSDELPGRIGSDGVVGSPKLPRSVLAVHSVCGRSAPVSDYGLYPGAHSATLRAKIAGVAQPLSATVSFTLSCPEGTCDAGGCVAPVDELDAGVDAGTSELPDASVPYEPDAGGSYGGFVDAGLNEKGAPGGGCSSAGGGLSLFALAALMARRVKKGG